MVWRKDENGNWGNFPTESAPAAETAPTPEPAAKPATAPTTKTEVVTLKKAKPTPNPAALAETSVNVSQENELSAVFNNLKKKPASRSPSPPKDSPADTSQDSEISEVFKALKKTKPASRSPSPPKETAVNTSQDSELSAAFNNLKKKPASRSPSPPKESPVSTPQESEISEVFNALKKTKPASRSPSPEIKKVETVSSDNSIATAPTTNKVEASKLAIDVENPEVTEEASSESGLEENKDVNTTADASSDSGSSSSSSSRKRKKGAMSNQKMCMWIFGFVILATICAVAFSQIYYAVKRRNERKKAESNGSILPGGTGGIVVPTAPVPPPTHPPTYGPTSTLPPTKQPTVAPPTQAPTMDYIEPLMEFLQDNQVYFERNPVSPDFMAVQWLAEEAQFKPTEGVSSAYGNGLELSKKLIQRFALLTLDFALLRPNATDTEDVAPSTPSTPKKQLRDGLASNALHADYTAFELAHYARSNTIAVKGIDECLWEGVTCADVGQRAGEIEEINFSHSGMSGTIPPEIKLLKNLKKLDLAANKIHGPIPEELYSIRGLQEVYLFHNHLTGSLSPSIGNWNNITRLHLSHNQLTGSIPISFKSDAVQIRPIEYLNLYSNQFTGSIPENLRFRSLRFADFGRNQFSGQLPDDIGEKWVWLRFLYLDHNKFTGTIPYSYPETGNGRVEAMRFNNNQLTGYVPGQFQLNKLLDFSVADNSFTGIDKTVCKQSVWEGGEMVEFKADCDICICNPFCRNYCGDNDRNNWW